MDDPPEHDDNLLLRGGGSSSIAQYMAKMRPPNIPLSCTSNSSDTTSNASSISYSSPIAIPRTRTVNISFSSLSYSVKTGVKRESKTILSQVNGDFQSGELTAIMGPSGGGKSTLMNILAGYTTRGVAGSVKVNNVERNVHEFKKHSSYIMQDDMLQPLLTVQEAMAFAASLKLGSQLTHCQKEIRIKTILDALALHEARKTLTGDLSGGQRKRLAIALELVNNPPVMFFDEPTSGLDSSTSSQCVSLLKRLAREGRTIICTIHQPSALIFEMFNHLYMLTEGVCIYQGSTKGMVPYLSELGLNCPPYHNPADYILEVASGDYGNHVDDLKVAIKNGKCNDWRSRPFERGNSLIHEGPLTPIHAPDLPLTQEEEENMTTTAKPKSSLMATFWDYPTTFWMQFYILLKRTFRIASRDRTLTQLRLLMHLLIGLLVGTLYFQIGDNAHYMRNNFGFLALCTMFLMFTAFSASVLTFPLEIPVITREHFNRWYSLPTYYLAITFSDVPVQTICTVGFCVIVYFMTSQPFEIVRLTLFTLSCALVAVVAQSIGLVIGVSMSIQNGMVFGPFAIMPFTIFSGFLILMNDAPVYVQWVFHVSYLKYALECVMWAIYSYDREKLNCPEIYCHYRSPPVFLKDLGMSENNYWFNIGMLVLIYFILRFISYVILHYRLINKR